MRKLSLCPGAVQVITRKIQTEASISVLRIIVVRTAILDQWLWFAISNQACQHYLFRRCQRLTNIEPRVTVSKYCRKFDQREVKARYMKMTIEYYWAIHSLHLGVLLFIFTLTTFLWWSFLFVVFLFWPG